MRPRQTSQQQLADCREAAQRDHGVPQNVADAAVWYRQAAEQGDAEAQYALGVLYAEGLGVPEDLAEAQKWHRKAAEQGLAKAQYALGLLYEFHAEKRSRTQWAAEAAQWYRRAAEQ